MRTKYPVDALDRLLAQMTIAPNGCWLWQGRLDENGYARIWTRGTHRAAHRVIYERVHVQLIPHGLVIDHLCKTRNCLNPAHMEPVTNEENVSRRAACRCGMCAKCRRNIYMRGWYARKKARTCTS